MQIFKTMNEQESYYYRILLAYELPFNVIDAEGDLDKIQKRENLYKALGKLIPEDKYERFTVKLIIHQLKDTFNYLVTYEAFFRSTDGLPMKEYTEAKKLEQDAERELEAFFDSQDCEYKKISIKTLL